jgi:hypothetical protein
MKLSNRYEKEDTCMSYEEEDTCKELLKSQHEASNKELAGKKKTHYDRPAAWYIYYVNYLYCTL